jgi:hypothetical protein
MNDSYSAYQQSVQFLIFKETNERLLKLEQKVIDLENFIKNQNFTNHKQQLINGQQQLLKGN